VVDARSAESLVSASMDGSAMGARNAEVPVSASTKGSGVNARIVLVPSLVALLQSRWTDVYAKAQ